MSPAAPFSLATAAATIAIAPGSPGRATTPAGAGVRARGGRVEGGRRAALEACGRRGGAAGGGGRRIYGRLGCRGVKPQSEFFLRMLPRLLPVFDCRTFDVEVAIREGNSPRKTHSRQGRLIKLNRKSKCPETSDMSCPPIKTS